MASFVLVPPLTPKEKALYPLRSAVHNLCTLTQNQSITRHATMVTLETYYNKHRQHLQSANIVGTGNNVQYCNDCFLLVHTLISDKCRNSVCNVVLYIY